MRTTLAIDQGARVLDSIPMPVGLPRPLVDNKPVPWTARFDRDQTGTIAVVFSAVDSLRITESYFWNACAVCGEKVGAEVAVIASDDNKHIRDGVGMHLRCARIALRHCPAFREGHSIWVGDDSALAPERDSSMPVMCVPDSFVRVATRDQGRAASASGQR